MNPNTPRTNAVCQSIRKDGIDWHHSATHMAAFARVLEQEAAVSGAKLAIIEKLAIEISLAVLRTATADEKRRIENQLTELQYAGQHEPA